jgi:threonine synthase
MKLDFTLSCSRCERETDTAGTPTVCAECGAPLLAVYPLEKIAEKFRPESLEGRPWDMWRYREVMPLGADEEPVSLGEGGTPLLSLPALAKTAGVRELLVKEEGLNPTYSFKARGMSAAVPRAVAGGSPGFVAPSAGNAAEALSAYGARAGVPVRVYMPKDTPPLVIAECRALGAQVELIDGVITDCGVKAREFAQETGYFDVSTLREPYRVEGKKTMGYEIAEQMGWSLPDAIIYPTGGGTGIIGMWKAFAEMETLGWLEPGKRPRMYVVQSAGCAPMVRAWESGAETAEPWKDPETIAWGLRVPGALGDFLILRAVRESGGAAVAVSDKDLLAAADELLHHGVAACPEGGATLAALYRLRADGHIGPDDSVICFNTGAWIKYVE